MPVNEIVASDQLMVDWPEKYRPSRLGDVVGQKSAVAMVSAILSHGLRRPLLFAGPVGDGKTSMARIVASTFLCEHEVKPCLKCSNCASIRRGGFAQDSSFSSYREFEGGWLDEADIDECMVRPYIDGESLNEILMIDEVQELSPRLQGMLLKPLEMSASQSGRRFILCTSDPARLTKAMRSRCDTISLTHVAAFDMEQILRNIASCEQMNVSKEALIEIVFTAGGHVRDAIAKLQEIHRRFPEGRIVRRHVFSGSRSKHELAAKVVAALVRKEDHRRPMSALDAVATAREIPELIVEALCNAIRIHEQAKGQADHLPPRYQRIFSYLPEQSLYEVAAAISIRHFHSLVDRKQIELFLAAVAYQHSHGLL